MKSPVVSCQNPDLDSELIRLCIRVLEKSDYLGSCLIVSNQIAYSSTKLMDISDGDSCDNPDLDSELIRLCIRFGKVGFSRNQLDCFEPNCIFM